MCIKENQTEIPNCSEYDTCSNGHSFSINATIADITLKLRTYFVIPINLFLKYHVPDKLYEKKVFKSTSIYPDFCDF